MPEHYIIVAREQVNSDLQPGRRRLLTLDLRRRQLQP